MSSAPGAIRGPETDILSTLPLTSNETLEMFKQTGAYLRGHFRLTSGLHSPEYLQCALVLQYPDNASVLGEELADRMGMYGKVNVVAAPAIGGLIIGHEVARHLGARFIFTERDAAGAMVLRRGFEVEPGECAVVVEDVVTTGGSSREVIDVLGKAGATVLAAGSIIDRSGGHVELGVPRAALATLKVISYPCQQGSPATKPGSRPGA
jgi:orotate phosphoribosyltransferase